MYFSQRDITKRLYGKGSGGKPFRKNFAEEDLDVSGERKYMGGTGLGKFFLSEHIPQPIKDGPFVGMISFGEVFEKNN